MDLGLKEITFENDNKAATDMAIKEAYSKLCNAGGYSLMRLSDIRRVLVRIVTPKEA